MIPFQNLRSQVATPKPTGEGGGLNEITSAGKVQIRQEQRDREEGVENPGGSQIQHKSGVKGGQVQTRPSSPKRTDVGAHFKGAGGSLTIWGSGTRKKAHTARANVQRKVPVKGGRRQRQRFLGEQKKVAEL